MEFTSTASDLAKAIAWAAAATGGRPAIPVYGWMHLDVADESVTITGTDGDVFTTAVCPAEVRTRGVAMLPGLLTAAIGKALPGASVTITGGKADQMVTSGPAKWKLPGGFDPHDFPALPQMTEPAGLIESDDLAEAISQVAVAVGNDPALPTLSGLLLVPGEDTLTLVATDRYRLTVREIPWTITRAMGALPDPVLLPGSALKRLPAVLKSGEKVQLCIVAEADGVVRMVGFRTDTRQLLTRPIGGDYVNWQGLVATTDNVVAEAAVAAGPLAEAVQRVSIVNERPGQAVSFEWLEEGLVITGGRDATAREVVPILACEGAIPQVGFNPEYVRDAAATVGSEIVTFGFTAPGRGFRITDGSDSPAYRHVLMPIRL